MWLFKLPNVPLRLPASSGRCVSAVSCRLQRISQFFFNLFLFFPKEKKKRQQSTETQNDNMRAARVKVWAEQLDKERRANKKEKS